MLREVRHLASIRHNNVVGYNQAWIEITRSRKCSNDDLDDKRTNHTNTTCLGGAKICHNDVDSKKKE